MTNWPHVATTFKRCYCTTPCIRRSGQMKPNGPRITRER